MKWQTGWNVIESKFEPLHFFMVMQYNDAVVGTFSKKRHGFL